MPANPSTPEFTIFPHGRQWYCRFSYGGRQRKLRVGPQDSGGEEEIRAAATAIVASYIAQFERAAAERKVYDPFALYARRLTSRSDQHIANCARFHERFIEYFAGRDPLTLTRSDMESWRSWLLSVERKDEGKGSRGLSIKTVSEHLDYVASVFNHAGLPNPCLGVERPKQTHNEQAVSLEYFTGEQMELLFQAAEKHPAYRNGFILLAYTGCRISEIQFLELSAIDHTNKAVSVVGKGSKRRPLQLTGPLEPAWEALMDEIKTHPEGRKPYVFPGYGNWGRKMLNSIAITAFGSRDVVRTDRRGNKHIEKMPLIEAHPHKVRHSFATAALLTFDPPWDLPLLSKWLGHQDISVTFKIYGHLVLKQPPSGWIRTKLEQ